MSFDSKCFKFFSMMFAVELLSKIIYLCNRLLLFVIFGKYYVCEFGELLF